MIQSSINPTDILLVSPNQHRRSAMESVLAAGGYSVSLADSAQGVLNEVYPSSETAVVVIDYNLSIDDQLLLAKNLRANSPLVQVILLSAGTSVANSIKASNSGVFWILPEPYQNEDLLYVVARGLIVHQLAIENARLKEVLGNPGEPEGMVCSSDAMQRLMHRIQRIASLDAAVLLTGESGTGKTLLASTIHKGGGRRDEAFVTVSCANLPRDLLESELFGHEKGAFTGAIATRPGTIELAHKGTLFLDEIGELPLELQPKLLTFLQDKHIRRLGGKSSRVVDVRVICATNRNLEDAVREGLFREDLFYRINVLHLEIPPLRERKADIPHLVDRSIRKIAARQGRRDPWLISPDSLNALENYHWPGNIRQLEHVLERATAYSDNQAISPTDLDLTGSNAPQRTPFSMVGHTLDQIEDMLIRQTFEHCTGDKVQTARLLGVSLKTVYNKLKALGIS